MRKRNTSADRYVKDTLGFPDTDSGLTIDFTASAASGLCDPITSYRLAATEDCYVKISTPGGGLDVDSDDVLLFAGVPEVFRTTASQFQINVIQKDSAGTLHITKMTGP